VPARIIGVVLDKLAIENDALDFGGSDQPIRARHLLHGMRQKEETLASRSSDLADYLGHLHHCPGANLPEATARGGPFPSPGLECQGSSPTLPPEVNYHHTD